MHEGNHNTEVAAPLAILGIKYPENVHSIGQWLKILWLARRRVKAPADVDVVVQELGTDRPGDIAAFGQYMRPDIAVVTGVTPEHMEFFGTIEAVASEELSVSNFAREVLINRNDTDPRFADFESNPQFWLYGTGLADYRFEGQDRSVEQGYTGLVMAPEFPEPFKVTLKVVGEHSLRPLVGAFAVAARLTLTPDEIQRGIMAIRPVPGRMNLLRGIGGITIIDDSYNSSPAAASAAIQSLYEYDQAPQRIAILGDMRELGSLSQSEHEKIGAMCDPNLLAWVVTVGPESEKYLAPIARQRGCQVKSFMSAIDAGAFVRGVTQPGDVVLVKGSQTDIYTEEAVKVLCDMSEDVELVRQSPEWQSTKDAFFSRFK